jgi:hypothetical protein
MEISEAITPAVDVHSHCSVKMRTRKYEAQTGTAAGERLCPMSVRTTHDGMGG